MRTSSVWDLAIQSIDNHQSGVFFRLIAIVATPPLESALISLSRGVHYAPLAIVNFYNHGLFITELWYYMWRPTALALMYLVYANHFLHLDRLEPEKKNQISISI